LATVAITGILVIITAYYAISTENILRVNAHYASTTDEILEVNRKTLELLIVQKRSAKVEEIARTICVPLDEQIKRIQVEIKDKSNVIALDPTRNRIKIQSLIHNIYSPKTLVFPTTLDFISSQFETLKIDTNYEDPIFQKYIRSILGFIEEYDNEQKEYELFLDTIAIPFFSQKILLSFTEKLEINHKYTPPRIFYEHLFRSLMIGAFDYSMEKEFTTFDPSHFILNEYPHFIDDCYQNNIEFRTLIEKKSKYEERLIKKLELLSTELNSLLSEWMNVYHIVLIPSPNYTK